MNFSRADDSQVQNWSKAVSRREGRTYTPALRGRTRALSTPSSHPTSSPLDVAQLAAQ